MSQKTTHGIKRIKKATRYSLQGLKVAFKTEPAFKEEVLVGILMIFIALLLEVTSIERSLLIGSVVLVWMIELVNSAIEAVVDRVSKAHHPLSGRAKDMGSAAVMLAIFLCGYIWIEIVFI
ncbi:diacylglycerol kinase [Vibrio sonorensis]|uniref:diacylglycerol kinase n=1 Tax=Vibrio sonorensis TaxID=1004316 RepID=UPI0008DA5B95|nr:diacylglycerol kinase [Vibrio sonorensis]